MPTKLMQPTGQVGKVLSSIEVETAAKTGARAYGHAAKVFPTSVLPWEKSCLPSSACQPCGTPPAMRKWACLARR